MRPEMEGGLLRDASETEVGLDKNSGGTVEARLSGGGSKDEDVEVTPLKGARTTGGGADWGLAAEEEEEEEARMAEMAGGGGGGEREGAGGERGGLGECETGGGE